MLANRLIPASQQRPSGFPQNRIAQQLLNRDPDSLAATFAHLFDSAIFSSRERLKKPDPRIYQLACERLGVRPEDCLYIADGENRELAAAAKVGLHSVLIRNLSRDNGSELLREAREWQGMAISSLPEAITLLSIKDE